MLGLPVMNPQAHAAAVGGYGSETSTAYMVPTSEGNEARRDERQDGLASP